MDTAAAIVGASFAQLLRLFERERAVGRPLVLATVVRTEGSTYSKCGAQMLIAADGEYAGLLSGGCLELDIAHHAIDVLKGGRAQRLHYDARGPDDLLFGLGSGCEGAMDILLQPLTPEQRWQPMTRLAAAWQGRRLEHYRLVVQSENPAIPPGTALFDDALAAIHWPVANLQTLELQLHPSPGLLILGAGPDTLPVAQMIDFLGWRATIVDHRAAYARAERFPAGASIVQTRPDQLSSHVDVAAHAAAVVMTHHYATDLAYLRVLAESELSYIGLLGPPTRSDRLLGMLGGAAIKLRGRLHSPVGLPIGARSPQGIALAIVAQIHGALNQEAAMPDAQASGIAPMAHRTSER
jgi:xanthine dehydrogenase accessory factor